MHLAPFFGSRSMDAIQPEDVLDLVTVLEDKKLAPKSIRNIVGTLSALFNFAKGPQRRWATANPCEGVELPAVPASDEIRFLTLDEIDALVAHARPGIFRAIDRAIYRTAAMTGLRQGELLALRWRDVDWPAARIRVRQNYVLGEFGTPKSKRSTRSVPMADEVAGELDRLFKQSRVAGRRRPRVRPPGHTARPLSKRGVLKRHTEGARGGEARRRRTASTTCATRSEPGWRRPACRCGRCRSGWATATSRRRSSMPTTRRARARRRWSRLPSRETEVAIQVAI